jgi:protoheme IX farnesyltransferase
MVAPAVSPSVPFSARLGGFVALTKPRIIELLLITTVPTMVVAEGGLPSVWLMVATVIGGAFAAGGANAINMVVDRDIDARMEERGTGRWSPAWSRPGRPSCSHSGWRPSPSSG